MTRTVRTQSPSQSASPGGGPAGTPRGLPAGDWHLNGATRIAPLPRAERSTSVRFFLKVIRKVTREDFDYTVFTTLARLGRIFPVHAYFVSQLLYKGRIPVADKERVILRVAHRTGCAYEWAHHSVMAQDQGVTRLEIESIARTADDGWTPRTRALFAATDDLLTDGRLTADTWHTLREHLDEDRIVEVCMLVGHYVMGAMIINTSGCAIEPRYLASLGESWTAAPAKDVDACTRGRLCLGRSGLRSDYGSPHAGSRKTFASRIKTNVLRRH
ncbi:carboxymuconolactone decarboxylase family protein [Streptomyces sp. NPDC094468]|uniref:carboxymuconolactone decarboxylase family protein n=1 Tax=Streptomyces sp. NPDC094468 TaxID=3366066 RepID=UPI00381EDE3B